MCSRRHVKQSRVRFKKRSPRRVSDVFFSERDLIIAYVASRGRKHVTALCDIVAACLGPISNLSKHVTCSLYLMVDGSFKRFRVHIADEPPYV